MGVAEESAAQAADALSRLHPRAFFERLLSQGVRPDGRSMLEPRPRLRQPGWLAADAAISAGNEALDNDLATPDASSSVRMGGTWVVCGARVLVGAPLSTRPGEGWVSVTVHGLDAAQAEVSGELRRLMQQMVDLETLSLVENTECMVICVDVCVLADDGGARDAAVEALTVALKDLKLPQLVKEADETGVEQYVVVEDTDGQRHGENVQLCMDPVAHTFGLFRAESQSKIQLVRDPTLHEQGLLDGIVHVVVDKTSQRTLHILKPDGIALPSSVLFRILDLALEN